MATSYWILLCAGTLAGIALAPATRWLAHRANLVDRPDGRRKVDGRVTPLGGGIAVYATALAVMFALLAFPSPWQSALVADSGRLLALGVGCTLLLTVGLIDDRFELRGRHKLLAQILVCIMLAASGFTIQRVELFGESVSLGVLAAPLSVLWLLSAINALNLIDGMDGLATGVGLTMMAAILPLALMLGHTSDAVLAVAFAGAMIGFLCYNFPPAQQFLGDAGSMLIGLVLGALSLFNSSDEPNTVRILLPLAIWTIPALDVAAAIVRRKLTGRSIYNTDRAHLHHCMLARLGTPRRTLAVVAACSLLNAAGAVASKYWNNDWFAAASCLSAVAFLVAMRLFGHSEALLLASRIKSFALSLSHPFTLSDAEQATAIQLQGTRQWGLLWESLTQFADKLNLLSIQLNVNLPAMQEGYHATWRRPQEYNPERVWRTEIPLFAGSHSVGRLTIAGFHDGQSACELIERLMDLLQPYEALLLEMARVDPPHATATHAALRPLEPGEPRRTDEGQIEAASPHGAALPGTPVG